MHLRESFAESEKGFWEGGSGCDGANGIADAEEAAQHDHFAVSRFDGQTGQDRAQGRQLVILVQGVHLAKSQLRLSDGVDRGGSIALERNSLMEPRRKS